MRLLDEHLNPVYLEAAQIDRAAVAQLGAPNYYELYKRFGFRLDELAEECRELLDETEKLWERKATGSSARGSESGSTRRARGTSPGSSARRSSTRSTRRTGCCRRSRRRSPTSASTCASQENVHLDLDARPSKTPRAFCAPIEVPGQGDARDPADRRQGRLGGALPRGRPHRALRAHERRPPDRGQAARRHGGHRGLGDAARAPRHRAGVAEPPPRRAAPARPRGRRRDVAPLFRAPLRREAPVRDRVLPGRRPDADARAATSSC